jgi:hypothetical protein
MLVLFAGKVVLPTLHVVPSALVSILKPVSLLLLSVQESVTLPLALLTCVATSWLGARGTWRPA